MQALIKDMDKNKKLLDFRLIDGTEDLEYFNENGYTNKQEVEQCYTGDWYIKGYAPSPSEDELKCQVRMIRDTYLQETDFTQLSDAPYTQLEKEEYSEYRQYLRNYTNIENWWLQYPLSFNDWKES